MTARDWALLLHIFGVALLFSGITLAAVAVAAARRRELAGEIASLLALTRTGVLFVVAGAVAIFVSGLWLIQISDGFYSLGDGWIAGALGLLALAFVLGAIGGQKPKRARVAATRAAAEGDPAPENVHSLLDDRASVAFNYASALCIVAALVIMIWKPGL